MAKLSTILSVRRYFRIKHFWEWHCISNLAINPLTAMTLATYSASRSLSSYQVIRAYWLTSVLSSKWIPTACRTISSLSIPSITTIPQCTTTTLLLIIRSLHFSCQIFLRSKINRIQFQTCIRLVFTTTKQTLLR